MRSSIVRHQGGVASALNQWTPAGTVLASSLAATQVGPTKGRSYGNAVQKRYPFHSEGGVQVQAFYQQQVRHVASFANNSSNNLGNSQPAIPSKSHWIHTFVCVVPSRKMTAMAQPAPHVLTVDNINPNIKAMEYAVRGPLVIRAIEIQKELAAVSQISGWIFRYC